MLPCPGRRKLKSSFEIFSREAINSEEFPDGKSVLPKPLRNKVSPENSSPRLFSKKQTLPFVCPGVNKTSSLKLPRFIVSLLLKKEVIFGKCSVRIKSAAVKSKSFLFTKPASNLCMKIFACGKRKSPPKWSACPWVWRTIEIFLGEMPAFSRDDFKAEEFACAEESIRTGFFPLRRKTLLPIP